MCKSKFSLLLVVMSILLLSGMTQAALLDITTPGDTIKGVPDDGDWPTGEYPALAIDNRVTTKYLHFKGDFDPTDPPGGAGFRVTPSARQTIVTGLTFTTANDAPERDPTAFALSGSNVSIDGPYTLIASGDIVDFKGAASWPRFTKNTTEISFANSVAYDHYQITFTDIRNRATANSMQIAEVELLGVCLKAFSPTPSDGEAGVALDAILSWSPGVNAATHDVYFGTSSPPALVGNQTETSYNPGPLEYGTTYYWRIDEVNTDGTISKGKTWSFRTTAPVGPFEYTKDIGGPRGIGYTIYKGVDAYGGRLVDKYFMTAGGADIWGNADQGHFAYKTVTGDMRLSVGYTWQAPRNDWTKAGPMFRVSLDGPSVQYFCTSKKNHDRACFQFRSSTGGSSSSEEYLKTAAAGSPDKPLWLGIQRVTIEGIPFLEGLVDWGKGKGWERVGNLKMALHLPDEILLGVAMTSHETDGTAQAWIYDPWYEKNPKLVGPAPTISVIPATAAIVFDPAGKTSGFKIRAIKAQFGQIDSYTVMNQILDFGCTGPMCLGPGMPIPGAQAGERVEQFVNLRDTGDGVFGNNQSYPGIDPLEQPAPDPAGGDDDEDFAVEITGVIQLTAGSHIIGVNSDDGAQIDIGGAKVETVALKGNSNEDFIIKVEADGFYPLKVRHMERGGGSSIELHEVLLPSGTRILLNDVAAGGSAVYAP